MPICDWTIEMTPVLTVEKCPECLRVDPSTIYRGPTGDNCPHSRKRVALQVRGPSPVA